MILFILRFSIAWSFFKTHSEYYTNRIYFSSASLYQHTGSSSELWEYSNVDAGLSSPKCVPDGTLRTWFSRLSPLSCIEYLHRCLMRCHSKLCFLLGTHTFQRQNFIFLCLYIILLSYFCNARQTEQLPTKDYHDCLPCSRDRPWPWGCKNK